MRKIYVESSKRTGDVVLVMEWYRSQAAAKASEEKRRRFMSERRNFRRRRAVSLK